MYGRRTACLLYLSDRVQTSCWLVSSFSWVRLTLWLYCSSIRPTLFASSVFDSLLRPGRRVPVPLFPKEARSAPYPQQLEHGVGVRAPEPVADGQVAQVLAHWYLH